MKILLFNPEHDIALATNLKQFTPPRAGRQLRHDLGFLPMLWANDEDLVLVDDIEKSWQDFKELNIQSKGTLVDKHLLKRLLSDNQNRVINAEPWGWDMPVWNELNNCGVSIDSLPTSETMDCIRRISHRSWATHHLLDRLTVLPRTLGTAIELFDITEVERLLSTKGVVVMKEPWSSSGRGVRRMSWTTTNSKGGIGLAQKNWICNVISRQGSIMTEPYYNKVMDFGMEFESDGQGKVYYVGLSLFATNHGSYTGNVIDSEDNKMRRLSEKIPFSLLEEVKNNICEILREHFRDVYAGPFGIDMMIVQENERYLLHPCVELNLRMTMGHVALALSQRMLPQKGIMSINYKKSYHLNIETVAELS